jgi:hypothetical protein
MQSKHIGLLYVIWTFAYYKKNHTTHRFMQNIETHKQ